MSRLISFRKIRQYCRYNFRTLEQEQIKNKNFCRFLFFDRECSTKNCPIWGRLKQTTKQKGEGDGKEKQKRSVV